MPNALGGDSTFDDLYDLLVGRKPANALADERPLEPILSAADLDDIFAPVERPYASPPVPLGLAGLGTAADSPPRRQTYSRRPVAQPDGYEVWEDHAGWFRWTKWHLGEIRATSHQRFRTEAKAWTEAELDRSAGNLPIRRGVRSTG